MPAALVLVAAGVLNLVISQNRSAIDPCVNPNGLARISTLTGFEPEGRMRDQLTSTVIDWAEGTVASTSTTPPIDVWMIRSIRPAELYERPVRYLERKISPEIHDLVQLQTSRGTIPVHLLEDYTTNPGTIVGYLMIYGNEPTANAFSSHARGLWNAVTQGATPLTLVLVGRQAIRRGSDAGRESVTQILGNAWENFDSACRP